MEKDFANKVMQFSKRIKGEVEVHIFQIILSDYKRLHKLSITDHRTNGEIPTNPRLLRRYHQLESKTRMHFQRQAVGLPPFGEFGSDEDA